MNQNQRRARIISMRKGQPLPRIRAARVPDTVLTDLDAIDAATDDPAIHAATARIRAALDGAEQQPAAEAEQDDTVHACPGRWGGPNCRCFDAEPAPGEQQAAAADGEETRCTCGDAGDAFVPLGHYRDCPLADDSRA